MSLTTAEQIRQRPQSPEVLIENTLVITFKKLWEKGVDTVILQKGKKYERNWHYQNPNDGELFYPIKFSSNITRDDVVELLSKKEYGYTLVDIDGDRLSVSWRERSLETPSPLLQKEDESPHPLQKDEKPHKCSPSDIHKFTSYLEFRQYDLFKLELCPTHHTQILNTLLISAIENKSPERFHFLVDLGAEFNVDSFAERLETSKNARDSILVHLAAFKLSEKCKDIYTSIHSHPQIRKLILDYATFACLHRIQVDLQCWLKLVPFTQSEILTMISVINPENSDQKCLDLLIKYINSEKHSFSESDL